MIHLPGGNAFAKVSRRAFEVRTADGVGTEGTGTAVLVEGSAADFANPHLLSQALATLALQHVEADSALAKALPSQRRAALLALFGAAMHLAIEHTVCPVPNAEP